MSSQRTYDWGSKEVKKEDVRKREPIRISNEEHFARVEANTTTPNQVSVPIANATEFVPHHVNLEDPFGMNQNQFPGEFRFHKMPDETTVDIMTTPEGVGKWDQILFYMSKRPIVPISAIGVLGSFASSIVSLITKQPSKTTHFWANMTVGFKVLLIGSIVGYAYYPPKFNPIFKPKDFHTELKE